MHTGTLIAAILNLDLACFKFLDPSLPAVLDPSGSAGHRGIELSIRKDGENPQ